MTFNGIVNEQTNLSESKPVRRPYAAPRLTVHGTVAELTQAKLIKGPFAATYLTTE